MGLLSLLGEGTEVGVSVITAYLVMFVHVSFAYVFHMLLD